MSWPQIKKKYHCFEVSSSLTLCNNNNPFRDWIVTCDEKWILYKWQRSTQWLDEEAPKYFQSPNAHKKKVMVTGGLLPVWFTTAFWILANHYIRGVCSTNWREALKTQLLSVGIGQQKVPNSSPWQHPTTPWTTSASKAERIGLWSFTSSTIIHLTFPQLTTTSSSILTTFYMQNAFTTSRRQKCCPRFHGILKRGVLHYRNKHTYFSLARNVLIVMVPILINKDVFDPSYNDLKFMVRSWIYFCNNLIASNQKWKKLSNFTFLWDLVVH